MGQDVESFIAALRGGGDVILLGGVAVILMGLQRQTADVDIWLQSDSGREHWAAIVAEALKKFPGATCHRLPGWTVLEAGDIAEAADETGMIRILGLDRPLDIFYRPNEFEVGDFQDVKKRATRLEDGSFCPDAIDLVQSKLDTGREKDNLDRSFLENLVISRYLGSLPTASLAEVEEMLARYSDFRVLESALTNPDPAVQKLARGQLQEFADQGDPFSLAILEGREIPPAS